MSAAHSTTGRRRPRPPLALLAAATVLGLWMGLGGAEVSPVVSAATAPAAVVTTDARAVLPGVDPGRQDGAGPGVERTADRDARGGRGGGR